MIHNSNRVRAVLFDLDGVLIDSRSSMAASYQFAVRGLPDAPPFETYEQFQGLPLAVIFERLSLPASCVDEYADERERQLRRLRPQPGAQEMLATLAALAVPMAVVTGKDRYAALQALTQVGILQYFGAVVGSDETIAPKPAADHALVALARLGDIRPHSALLVGDGRSDIQCARAAGCVAGAAVWGFGSTTMLAEEMPDATFEQPSDVAAWVLARRNGHVARVEP